MKNLKKNYNKLNDIIICTKNNFKNLYLYNEINFLDCYKIFYEKHLLFHNELIGNLNLENKNVENWLDNWFDFIHDFINNLLKKYEILNKNSQNNFEINLEDLNENNKKIDNLKIIEEVNNFVKINKESKIHNYEYDQFFSAEFLENLNMSDIKSIEFDLKKKTDWNLFMRFSNILLKKVNQNLTSNLNESKDFLDKLKVKRKTKKKVLVENIKTIYTNERMNQKNCFNFFNSINKRINVQIDHNFERLLNEFIDNIINNLKKKFFCLKYNKGTQTNNDSNLNTNNNTNSINNLNCKKNLESLNRVYYKKNENNIQDLNSKYNKKINDSNISNTAKMNFKFIVSKILQNVKCFNQINYEKTFTKKLSNIKKKDFSKLSIGSVEFKDLLDDLKKEEISYLSEKKVFENKYFKIKRDNTKIERTNNNFLKINKSNNSILSFKNGSNKSIKDTNFNSSKNFKKWSYKIDINNNFDKVKIIKKVDKAIDTIQIEDLKFHFLNNVKEKKNSELFEKIVEVLKYESNTNKDVVLNEIVNSFKFEKLKEEINENKIKTEKNIIQNLNSDNDIKFDINKNKTKVKFNKNIPKKKNNTQSFILTKRNFKNNNLIKEKHKSVIKDNINNLISNKVINKNEIIKILENFRNQSKKNINSRLSDVVVKLIDFKKIKEIKNNKLTFVYIQNKLKQKLTKFSKHLCEKSNCNCIEKFLKYELKFIENFKINKYIDYDTPNLVKIDKIIK